MPKIGAPASAAAPAKTAAAAPVLEYSTSATDDYFRNPIIVLHGPYGAGKTLAAASASEHAPDQWPTKRLAKAVLLEDMFWLAIDQNARDSIRDRGYDVLGFDFNRFLSDKALQKKAGFANGATILNAMELGLKEALRWRTACKARQPWIVVDTPSRYDLSLNKFYQDHPVTNTRGATDTRAMFGLILAAHVRLAETLLSLGCGVIYCVHSKSLGSAVDDPKQAEATFKIKLTLASAGMPDIVPAITGKGAGVYKSDCGLEFYLHTSELPGGKGLKRELATVQLNTAECKNRYGSALEPREEPHLGRIFKKILAGIR